MPRFLPLLGASQRVDGALKATGGTARDGLLPSEMVTAAWGRREARCGVGSQVAGSPSITQSLQNAGEQPIGMRQLTDPAYRPRQRADPHAMSSLPMNAASDGGS